MKKLTIILSLSCLLIAVFLIPSPKIVLAEEKYPTRTIKMILTVSAGGGLDIVVRKLCGLAEKSLGQEIIIEYKTGKLVGESFLLKSKPDGYTICALLSTVFVTYPIFMKLDFDPLTAYTPIMQIIDLDVHLLVPTSSSIKTVKEFIEEGHKRRILVAGIGGTSIDVAVERLAFKEKMDLKVLPFGGLPQAITAALGGQADAVASGGAVPWVRSGKLRPIARLTGKPREGSFIDVPTLKELGYDVEAKSFGFIAGPKGLPEPIEKKLEEVFTQALHDPSMLEALNTAGYILRYKNSNDLKNYWKTMYSEAIKEAKELGLGIYSRDKN